MQDVTPLTRKIVEPCKKPAAKKKKEPEKVGVGAGKKGEGDGEDSDGGPDSGGKD